MLKIGVLGAGHLGKIHLRLLEASEKYELVGFYDPIHENAQKVTHEFGYKAFDSLESLMREVDVVDIVTPTLSHFDCAKKAIEHGKHIFVEKPICNTISEAIAIRDLAKKKGIRGQVGHVERFNSAFTAVKNTIRNPMFIEAHRLAEFNPRGTDVPVVLDLMIHDIDIILSVVNSPVKKVQGNGVSVISKTPDIANARIEFQNGCVANITASRISMKSMRKTRFFQSDAYISIDFLKKKSELIKICNAPENPEDFALILKNAEGVKKQIYFENPKIIENNAILDELNAFAESIENNSTPIVSLKQGTEALRIAQQIINCL